MNKRCAFADPSEVWRDFREEKEIYRYVSEREIETGERRRGGRRGGLVSSIHFKIKGADS